MPSVNAHFTSQDNYRGGHLYFHGNKNDELTHLPFEVAVSRTGIRGSIRIQCPYNVDFIELENNGNVNIRGELVACNVLVYQAMVCYFSTLDEVDSLCGVGQGLTENSVKEPDGSLFFMSDRVPGFELRVDPDGKTWFGGTLLKHDGEVYNYFRTWLELAVGERLLTQKS